MSTPPKLVQRVLAGLQRLPTQKILVVEGPADLDVYGKWLGKLAAPNPFSSSLELLDGGGAGAGGGKAQVLGCLSWFAANGPEPRVFGLVDRDEWDTPTAADWRARLPQLLVNEERHALESYFCDPQESVPALLAIDPAWSQQEAHLSTTAEANRADYVCHWALLTLTERVKNGLGEQGYPGHFSSTIPIPPDDDIRARFALWSQTLDPQSIFQEFDALRQAALAATAEVQFRSHVWAKLFFEQVIVPILNGPPSVRLRTARDWTVMLAEYSPAVPTDIAALLGPLL